MGFNRWYSFALLLSCTAHFSSSKNLRAPSNEGDGSAAHSVRVLPERTVLCRVTIESTMMEDGSEKEVTICIPIKDGKETDALKQIELPNSVTDKNQKAINQGNLFLQISDADVSHSRVGVSARSGFKTLTNEEARAHYDNPEEHRRVLIATTGTQKVALVRISAPDGPNSYTKASLQRAWFGTTDSVRAQTMNCSFGALKWAAGPFYDIKLTKSITTYKTVVAVQTAVEAQLKLIVQKDLQYVASKIMFCYPKNSPEGGWVGSATLQGWRMKLNQDFCTSLSVSMHEIGHTIGLLHSAKVVNNTMKDYGDTTGYMGVSYYGAGAPDKCYNGQKNWQLGWYQGRRQFVTNGTVVRLVAFVDYKKAASNETVVVNVNNKYYLQYNRAKSFNYQTNMYMDKVTVTGMLGNGNSIVLAGLGVLESYSIGDTFIQVCSSETGSNGRDIMIVAINGACPGTQPPS